MGHCAALRMDVSLALFDFQIHATRWNLNLEGCQADTTAVSCVEANLMIICGSLPTLKRFLHHVAPKIVGETSQGSKVTKSSGTPGLRTFGDSGPKKRGYNVFGESETEFDLATIDVPRNDNGLRPDVERESRTVHVAGMAETRLSAQDCQKLQEGTKGGILQQSTTTVEVEVMESRSDSVSPDHDGSESTKGLHDNVSR